MSKIQHLLGLRSSNQFHNLSIKLSKWLLACLIVVTVSHQSQAQVPGAIFFRVQENSQDVFYPVKEGDITDFSKVIFTIDKSFDSDLFRVSPKGGRVSFKTPPDFEIPKDEGRNNVYDLQLNITLNNEVSTQRVVFAVVNQSDEPDIISQPTIRVLESEDYYYELEVAENPVDVTALNLPEWLTLTNQGEVETLVGFLEILPDVTGNSVYLGEPQRVAVDEEGNLYVNTFESIYQYTYDGAITYIAGSGSGFTDGSAKRAQFGGLLGGMVLDADRNIYISDQRNHSIRKITPNRDMTTIMGDGTAGIGMGDNGLHRLDTPFGLDVDAAGNLYIADAGNGRIVKLTTAGELEVVATGLDGVEGLVIDRDNGDLFVADTNNSLIKKITPDGTMTVFAGGGDSHRDDGTYQGTDANFSGVGDMVIDRYKNLYVVSGLSIRKITPSGVMTNLLGKTNDASNVNNHISRGVDYGLRSLLDLAVDHLGNMYITDHLLRRASISTIISGDASGHTGTHAVSVRSTAASGETYDQSFNIVVSTVDNVAPSVVNVTSKNLDEVYGYEDTIEILVQFDEAVTVTGSPSLDLARLWGTTKADYIRGSGSNTLVFSFTVEGGHSTTDQAYNGIGALSVEEGSIADTAGNEANLTLPVPGESGSLSANKDLKVEATPTITMSIGPDTLTNEATDRVSNLIFELSHPTFRETTVFSIVSGTAVEGADYQFPESVTASGGNHIIVIPPNEQRAEYAFDIVSDDLREAHETIVVDLVGASEATFSGIPRSVLVIEELGPPILMRSNPEEERAFTGTSISFVFNRDVVKGDGRISVFNGLTNEEVTGAGVASSRVIITDNVATLDLLRPLPINSLFYIRMAQGAFKGTEGLDVKGILDENEFIFSTFTKPRLIDSNPADDSKEFGGSEITLTFTRNMIKGTGRIRILDEIDGSEIASVGMVSSRITIDENVVTIDLVNPLPLNRSVYMNIPSSALENEEGIPFEGIQSNTTLNFSTKTRPRLVSSSPADDATEFSGSKITLTFDRDMSRGVGRIAVLDAADDSEISGVGASNERLTIDGNTVTIDLISRLPIDKQLYLRIPGSAFMDDDNIRYRGILDKTVLNFSTPATPKLVSTSPADESVEFEGTEVTFTFDKAVVAGRGRITIHNAADDEVIIDRGVNGPDVSITENVVTLDLKRPLRGSTDVYVNVSREAFMGENGLLFNGIDGKETLNFTTGSGPTEVNVGEFDFPVNSQSSGQMVRVFPNPAKNQITLDLSTLEGESTVQIIGIDGIVKLKKDKVTVQQLKLDVSKYADGIYLVKVRTQSGRVAYEKFMIRN